MNDDLSGFSLIDLFRSEAEGQTAALSEGLMALEGDDSPSATALESLMRAAHSLKGAARIVDLEAAVRVAHALEDNFVAAQRGEFAIGTGAVDVMLRAVDLLGRIAQLPEGGAATWQAENEATVAEVVDRLERLRIRPGGAPPDRPRDRRPNPPPSSSIPRRPNRTDPHPGAPGGRAGGGTGRAAGRSAPAGDPGAGGPGAGGPGLGGKPFPADGTGR